ncbi:hypothetical protein NADFUDRAFT_81156 [Nadsonia fulvescens var. elongata DSM 6958]|uniref:UBX domain-containing protein n=1 Tax=Nadsonia fulvescens var. elongata DSM 6958 TaxID=857566 RepID=A0A1E3PRM1_9ASCO|nr:hypothetical protein NADFUDRAFT_81156 [Nadsonia fulvescens var. elongata DSM 6958]
MDHDEKISQFCSITAANASVAENYLIVADGDLETAVTLFLESGGSLDGRQQSNSSNENAPKNDDGNIDSAVANADEAEGLEFARRLQEEEYGSRSLQGEGAADEVRERIQPRTETLVDPYEFYPPIRPQRQARSAGIFNQSYGSDFHRLATEEAAQIIGSSDEEDNAILPNVPRLSAHQSRLARLFRPPFDLMTNIDIDSARDLAREQKKFIIITIQDPTDFRCQVLNRDLWSDKDVKEAIKANFIFLQYEDTSNDGAQYLQFYPFEEYPHIAILDPRTGEQLKIWSEAPKASEWVQQVYDFLSQFNLESGHQNPIVGSTAARPKSDVNHMTEEEQIDLAVRQSLGQSKTGNSLENEIEVSDSDGDYMDADEGFSDLDDNEMTDTYATSTSKFTQPESQVASVNEDNKKGEVEIQESGPLTEEDIFASIIPQDLPEPTDPKTTTRLQIRLGDGTRIVRRFNLSDKIRDIYAFIKFSVNSMKDEYFALTSERRKLIEHIDETIESFGLKNAVVLVEVLE